MGNPNYKPWKNYNEGHKQNTIQIKNTENSLEFARTKYDRAITNSKYNDFTLDKHKHEQEIADIKYQLDNLKSLEYGNQVHQINPSIPNGHLNDNFIAKHGSPKDKRYARSKIKGMLGEQEHR